MSNNSQTQETQIIEPEYDPLLGENVKDRSYTNYGPQPNNTEPIQEPAFQQPKYNDFEDVREEKGESTFNKSYSDLGKKDKEMGAEAMTEVILDIYSKGCGFLGKLPEISEAKIDRLIADGDIAPDTAIPTQEGEVPIKDFAEAYNSEMKEAFEVSEEFKENVRPPLQRVLAKRGLAMTDEQQLGYYFLTDFGAKAVQAFALKKMSQGIIDSVKQHTQVMRENHNPHMHVVHSPSAQQPAHNQGPVTAASPVAQTQEQFVAETQYNEPEETVQSNINDAVQSFETEPRAAANAPKFGDQKILAHMEEIANQNRQQRRNAGPKRMIKRNKPAATKRKRNK